MTEMTVEQIKGVLKALKNMEEVTKQLFCPHAFSGRLREEVARKISPVFEMFEDFDWYDYIQVNLTEYPGFYCLATWDSLLTEEKLRVGTQCPKWAFEQIAKRERR